MKQKKRLYSYFANILVASLMLLVLASCKKEVKKNEKKVEHKQTNKLSYEVENKTGKTLYITGFAYLHKRPLSPWHWSKTPIYTLKDDQKTIVMHTTIQDSVDRKGIFGYLAVFSNKKEAEDATIELLPESNVLDLDLLSELHDKKVVIEIERYGFKGPFLDYDLLKKDAPDQKIPELDFFIKNSTGKTLYVACFAYEKKAKGRWIAAIDEKDDMSLWRFDKVGVYKIEPDNAAHVDVDTVSAGRDRSVISGFLGLFDENEEQLALDATYELLEPQRKINLGLLESLAQKTINLEIEKYGIEGDLIDFTIKPINRINFTKVSTR